MKKLLLALGLLVSVQIASAQWEITSLGETGDTITFDGTIDDVNNGTFTGSGLTGSPGSGLLDSDAWRILGLSDGNTSYGGTHTTGDYAKGASAGGIFSGGIYAFAVASGDTAMGVQPTGSDWTPGDIILRVVNSTGDTADSFTIAYDLFINNNEGRGNNFNFLMRINSGNDSSINALDELSTEASQGSVVWVENEKFVTITNPLLSGDTLYLIWNGSDSTGGGSRDEFALDNISVVLHGTASGGGGTGQPYYPISLITTTDANGVADSLGVECVINGVVLGVDLDGNDGYSFTLWDTVGINIFSSVDVDGYVVMEGDSIEMIGTVDQFNGLIQFTPDTIALLSTAGTVPNATLVTSLGESTESELMRIENMWIDAIFGSNYTLTDGTNTVVMRVDSDTDIPGNVDLNLGDTLCYAIGIGGQFDNSSPYTDGYQFFPQRQSDIDNSCGSAPPAIIAFYPIPDINNVDAVGEPDSLGLYCWTSGVVIGVDLYGNAGLSFTLWDDEGINVFNFVDVSAYEVTEGDSLLVRGTVGFYNGLTELIADSIEVINSGNSIPAPVSVSAPSEETESNYIRIYNVTVIDATEWPTTFSGNVRLLTCNGDTITMRVDIDTDVNDSIGNAPTGSFNVTGTGGQFDNSSPYTSGYQIFPMTHLDIDSVTNLNPALVINEVLSNNVSANTDENGDNDAWFEIRNDEGAAVNLSGLYFTNDAGDPVKYQVPNNSSSTIASGGYTLVWCDNESEEGDLHTNFDLSASGGYVGISSADGCGLIDELTFPALGADQSYGYYPEGTDTLVTFQHFSTTPGAMNVLDTVNSVGSLDTKNQLVVFPNPASSDQMVRFNKNISFSIFDITGHLIETKRNTNELSVGNLEAGTYILRTEQGDVLRMVIQ
jgi:hypothetical protein